MLRNEIQDKTGLTRKAMEYYEEKGLIYPQKYENGYRNYSDEDLEVLTKISFFRKLGMTVSEIEKCFSFDYNTLSSILRKKQHQLELDKKRKDLLELVIKGEERELVEERINLIEAEESLYEKLEGAFPDYLGQMLFMAYQPFLKEPLDKSGEEAFKKYVEYLDGLPSFELSKEEKEYIEKMSSAFDMQSLREVHQAKISAVENAEEWLKKNEDAISQYEIYKESEEYQNSMMKEIQDKLQRFMSDNKYYEIAIPLIRKFSRSYDDYYRKLLKANEEYLNLRA
ncbi:MAG: MerR family transcriptional regulator [Peptoniphilus sp.]|nr:MerR family transcriptional regulator [Peptoniphilus sp.]